MALDNCDAELPHPEEERLLAVTVLAEEPPRGIGETDRCEKRVNAPDLDGAGENECGVYGVAERGLLYLDTVQKRQVGCIEFKMHCLLV